MHINDKYAAHDAVIFHVRTNKNCLRINSMY